MTFAEYSSKSIKDSRILIELDISKFNVQWVNCGAGIWYVNFNGLYPQVDSSLLDGFTAQPYTDIGSVKSDSMPLTLVSSIYNLIPSSFYYNNNNKELYICLKNYDNPILHSIELGVIYGYSFNEFTPINSNTPYQARLKSSPTISISRDPLFFGKLQYTTGNVNLINSDGYFDSFGELNNVYGNECRIKFGYLGLDIDDYITLYNGIIGDVDITLKNNNISFIDPRKILTKAVQYTCTNKNALEVIEELLITNYSAQYTSTFFDLTSWELAKVSAPSVSINISGTNTQTVSDIIEMVCVSTFGNFLINSNKKYSFLLYKDIGSVVASTLTIINSNDILNDIEIIYSPDEVITSTDIGYSKNWINNSYTHFYSNQTESGEAIESSIYSKYKVYNEKAIFTILTTVADAEILSNKILNYAGSVYGKGKIRVSIKYYYLSLGDFIVIEFYRRKTKMFENRICEIMSIEYDLFNSSLIIGYRIRSIA